MSTAQDAIDGYLGKIARVFSAHWGVHVVVGGAGGLRTDVSKMIIYVPETAACLAASDRPAFEGALDHEVGHVRAEVDFPPGMKPSQLMEGLDPLRRHLFNLCEDVRLEISAGARWHGCKTNLDALRLWASNLNRAAHDEGVATPMQLTGLGFFCRAMGTPEMCHWLPPDIVELLDALQPLTDECARAATPLDTLQVAHELARILEELADPPPPPGEGEGEGEGEGDSPGRSSKPGEDKDGYGEGSPDGGRPGERTAKAIIRSVGEKREAGGDHDETPVHRAVEALSKKARDSAMASRSRHIPHPDARAADSVRVPPLSPHAAAEFARVREESAPYVGGVATRVVNLLRAPAPIRLSDRESGRVDSRALPGVRTGVRTAFSDELKLPGVNAAVVILLDASGSMCGAPIDMARKAAYTMGEALHRLRVPFEVLSWYESGGVSPRGLSKEDVALYTRFEGRLFQLYKSFGEKNWPAVAPRLMSYQAGGNNDDGGAVRDCARRLVTRKETLKVLLVLSDGAPCHAGSYGKTRGDEMMGEHLRDALRDCERAGIRPGGFGICSDHVQRFYKTWAKVSDLKDMPGAATMLLGKLLKR